MRAKGREQEGALDAVGRSGTVRNRTLQQVHRLVYFAQAGVHVGQMIGRYEGLLRSLLQLTQDRSGLRRFGGHSVRLTQLTQPERVSGGERNGPLQLGDSLLPSAGEEVG